MSDVPQTPPPPPPPPPPGIRNKNVIDATCQDLPENPPTSPVLSRDVLIEELTRIALKEGKNRASHCPQQEGVHPSRSGILTISSLLQPTLQQGPMCGLVAFEMAAQRLSPSLKSGLILEKARKLGYTRNGEMFSADQMANLAMHVLQCDATTLNTEDDWSTISTIVSSIAEGSFILIPYDADFNHSPALRKGHSAHWALLVGVTLFLEPSQADIIEAAFSPKKEQTQDNILLFFKEVCEMKDNEREAVMESIKQMSMNQVYVNARQGKSKYTGLWKVTDLIGSNRNLKEIAPKITEVPGEFITSNIDITLCSKMVVLHCR